MNTFIDADCRPEPIDAIVGHELASYNIAIPALSETRRAYTGYVKEYRSRLHLFLEWQNSDRSTCLF